MPWIDVSPAAIPHLPGPHAGTEETAGTLAQPTHSAPSGGPALFPTGAPSPPGPDRTLEANAYAISYRLLGDAAAAAAVAGIAAERLRQSGGMAKPRWLADLAAFTLDQTVETGALPVESHQQDPFSGLREALRRRLARATEAERVAGSLHHLSGYPIDFVAATIGRSEEETAALARILAPPPGVAYRELGDPRLTRATTGRSPGSAAPRRWRPRWSTVVAVLLILVSVVGATQCVGERPTLAPPADEAGLVVQTGAGTLSGMADRSPS
jgi:hypothetical protein